MFRREMVAGDLKTGSLVHTLYIETRSCSFLQVNVFIKSSLLCMIVKEMLGHARFEFLLPVISAYCSANASYAIFNTF